MAELTEKSSVKNSSQLFQPFESIQDFPVQSGSTPISKKLLWNEAECLTETIKVCCQKTDLQQTNKVGVQHLLSPPIAKRTRSSLPLNSKIQKEKRHILARKSKVSDWEVPSNEETAENNSNHLPQKSKLRNLTKETTAFLLKKLNTKSSGAIKKPRRKGLTLPEPFHFHKTVKRYETLETGPKSPFVPLVNKVKSFETETPDRFKAKPKAKKGKKGSTEHQLTHPQSPYLTTRLRSKTKLQPTTEELEIMEIQNMKPIKALPLNRKVIFTKIILDFKERSGFKPCQKAFNCSTISRHSKAETIC